MITRVVIPLAPVPAPRQVRSDTWAPRPSVERYRAFRDAVAIHVPNRLRDRIPDHGISVAFVLPMPKSWGKRKKDSHDNTPHRQRPDLDNLFKALGDSLWPDSDSHIWHLTMEKRWGREGSITITWYEEAGA